MWEGKTAGDDINFYALLGIVQCGMWLKNDIERYLLEFGLSYGRFSILLFLLEAGERKPAGIDLTAKLGIEKSTVAKMAEKLGSDGLVRVEADDDDLRKKRYSLTGAGRALLDRIVPGYLERMRVIGLNLSRNEKRQLITTLNKVNFLDNRVVLSQIRERPTEEIGREIGELCGSGTAEGIDGAMEYLTEDADIATTKIVDYYLGTVDTVEAMKRIEYYLFNGTQMQRNYCTLFFVRRNDWKLVNKAFRMGLIDGVQAYSK